MHFRTEESLTEPPDPGAFSVGRPRSPWKWASGPLNGQGLYTGIAF